MSSLVTENKTPAATPTCFSPELFIQHGQRIGALLKKHTDMWKTSPSSKQFLVLSQLHEDVQRSVQGAKEMLEWITISDETDKLLIRVVARALIQEKAWKRFERVNTNKLLLNKNKELKPDELIKDREDLSILLKRLIDDLKRIFQPFLKFVPTVINKRE